MQSLRRNSAVALLCLVALGACQPPGSDSPSIGETQPETATRSLQNGRLVFWAGGCVSCHSDPGPTAGKAPSLGGGLALKTGFGVFRVPNISPDVETGIGGWSLGEFSRAMRSGTAPDGTAYYPAFPYPSYTRMSDRDIADLWAYLGTLPKVSNRVAEHALAFPLRYRAAAEVWKTLSFRTGKVVELGAVSPEVARGQYLVEGPGHCAECHTPRNALGGLKHSRWLAGGPMLDDSGTAPNITPDETGLGGRSAAEIVEALTPSGPVDPHAFGMAAVRQNLSHLPASDLAAIAAYLKAIPPISSPPGG